MYFLNSNSDNFNPRPPRGGRHGGILDLVGDYAISIHAPREGGDTAILPQQYSTYNFNPRPPRGGRLTGSCPRNFSVIFQSTPPARGATAVQVSHYGDGMISIHAPREGGDVDWRKIPDIPGDFNPRPPRGGRLRWVYARIRTLMISIHAPREGGDYADCGISDGGRYFNPRPPRGGRHPSAAYPFPDH